MSKRNFRYVVRNCYSSSQWYTSQIYIFHALHCWFLLSNYRLRARCRGCALQWRHNDRDGVSNHQHHDCLLNRLFNEQIKENIKATRHCPFVREFTGDRWILHTKGSVTLKMFPFDYVIMAIKNKSLINWGFNKEGHLSWTWIRIMKWYDRETVSSS